MHRLILLMTATAGGMVGTAGALDSRIKVPGTQVSFELPDGFVAMPDDIKALKYSRGTPPTQVYSTPGPSWAVNIAFALREVKLPPGGLQAVQQVLEHSVSGVSGFRWVKHGLQKQAGREWIVMQFWVDGLDTPIYNDIRATTEQGKLLMVTANMTKAQYPKYVGPLTAALNSLR